MGGKSSTNFSALFNIFPNYVGAWAVVRAENALLPKHFKKSCKNYHTGAFCKIVPILRMAPSSPSPPPVFSNISKMRVLPFPSSPGPPPVF